MASESDTLPPKLLININKCRFSLHAVCTNLVIPSESSISNKIVLFF